MHHSKHTDVIKKNKSIEKEIEVVIPVAGCAHRMRSYGAKALLRLDKEYTIISRQIAVLTKNLPNSDIVVVSGFQTNRFLRALPNNIRLVENERYESNNVCRSLSLGIRACRAEKILIVYGDLVFNDQAIKYICEQDQTSVLVDRLESGDKEVGVIRSGDSVTNLTYDTQNKWNQIVLLMGKELKHFKDFVNLSENQNKYGYEALNYVIDKMGPMNLIEDRRVRVAEVDVHKDLEDAIKLHKECKI